MNSDVEFFNAYFQSHSGAIFGYLLGQIGSRESAEDLLQQIFVQVWRHVAVARDADLKWLFTIAKNRVVDFRRRQSIRGNFEIPLLDFEPIVGFKSEFENQELMKNISLAVAKLSDDLREVFVMSVVGEMSSPDIGEALGRPAGTVRSQISEARRQIRVSMGEGK